MNFKLLEVFIFIVFAATAYGFNPFGWRRSKTDSSVRDVKHESVSNGKNYKMIFVGEYIGPYQRIHFHNNSIAFAIQHCVVLHPEINSWIEQNIGRRWILK